MEANNTPTYIAMAASLPATARNWNVKETQYGSYVLANGVSEKRAKRIAADLNSGKLDAREVSRG